MENNFMKIYKLVSLHPHTKNQKKAKKKKKQKEVNRFT